MPQSSGELRSIFMVNGSDGIFEAEKVIADAGGKILGNGFIWLPEKINEETGKAAQFLLEEWDYAWLEPVIAVKILKQLASVITPYEDNRQADKTVVPKNVIHFDIVKWLFDYIKLENYDLLNG